MELFSSEFNRLESALNVLSAKHSVIASNVANIDTPKYKAKEINFQQAFSASLEKHGLAMKKSHEKHLGAGSLTSSPSAFVTEQVNNFMRNDGNNVNIDNEMLSLSENSIRYDMTVRMLSMKFEHLKYTISEGRRA